MLKIIQNPLIYCVKCNKVTPHTTIILGRNKDKYLLCYYCMTKGK